jgi:hypothetical protein
LIDAIDLVEGLDTLSELLEGLRASTERAVRVILVVDL